MTVTEDARGMGFKLRGALRCGACGKPRGLGAHLCNPGKRKRRRTTMQNPVTWECSTCRKPRGLNHTCVVRTDFKTRKRAATRRRAAAERKRKRQITAAKRKLRRQLAASDRRARDKARKALGKPAPRPRPRGDSHEPGTCGDRDCPRYGCKAYFQGMADCPMPHGG